MVENIIKDENLQGPNIRVCRQTWILRRLPCRPPCPCHDVIDTPEPAENMMVDGVTPDFESMDLEELKIDDFELKDENDDEGWF